MLSTELLFVYLYCLIDDMAADGALAIAPRPGPTPACTGTELLTIAIVRHVLGRRSESGFLAGVRRDCGHLFPVLPHQSEANRWIRWMWGAFIQFWLLMCSLVPEDDCQQVDTTALPVMHCSRVRGPARRRHQSG
jgi:hypothetical protein